MADAREDGASAPGPRRIAIAGNPNSGKTALFNALTGLRHQVANYPGVTVEKREGLLRGNDHIVLLDLPGTYSLSARSPDEAIARDILQGRLHGEPRPHGVLIVVDAANLERNLYLASQVLDFGVPAVIACNMMDIARSRGVRVDTEALSRELGVPVIPTVAATREGADAVCRAISQLGTARSRPRAWTLPPEMEAAIGRVSEILADCRVLPPHTLRGGALLWLMDHLSGDSASVASAEKFLGRLPPDAADAIRAVARGLAATHPSAAATAIEARYAWISQVASRVVHRASPGASRGTTRTDRIDRIVTHRVLGPLIFAVVMFVLFLSIFSWAEPLMSLIERGQDGLGRLVSAHMSDGPLRSLLIDGVLGGVGAVISFFPQICILFVCLAVLEDSGYMARAAFIMDRLMSRVGLHGRSFIPLLSSYACAIPGILATRTIEDRRDRFTTILIAPLMSCSARLPVYLIVIAAVFGDRTWLKAGVMFGLYALGTITALLVAAMLKRTLFAGPRPPFIMELPPYHMPRPGDILRAAWERARSFLTNAGTIIFAVCVIIWALSYYPRLRPADYDPALQARLAKLDPVRDADAAENIVAGARLRHSCIGRLGHFIEPAIAPLGFDWRLGIGILSSFLAREVFVGTMGITFSVGRTDENSEALRTQLAEARRPDGARVLTPLAGVSLLIFYVLACQCVSTLAVVKKEAGAWRWPAVMFAYMTALAYLSSLAVYQVGSRLGWGT